MQIESRSQAVISDFVFCECFENGDEYILGKKYFQKIQ